MVDGSSGDSKRNYKLYYTKLETDWLIHWLRKIVMKLINFLHNYLSYFV